LLDDARRELARKYLADARYSLGEVAHLLGFGDASNFFRACKRWFGLPPGQYREQLALVTT
jgi:AraC-like DNA-binding protein